MALRQLNICKTGYAASSQHVHAVCVFAPGKEKAKPVSVSRAWEVVRDPCSGTCLFLVYLAEEEFF